MQMYLRSPKALTNATIDEVYALAAQHDVGICLFGGTQLPSTGPAEWSASGSIFALRRFMKASGFSAIAKPSYPKVHWTDKGRWE